MFEELMEKMIKMHSETIDEEIMRYLIFIGLEYPKDTEEIKKRLIMVIPERIFNVNILPEAKNIFWVYDKKDNFSDPEFLGDKVIEIITLVEDLTVRFETTRFYEKVNPGS